MASDRVNADVAFIGHVCLDEVLPFAGPAGVAPGSAVLCGAMAAARIGTKVAVVTRMAPADDQMLDPMRQCGIDVRVIPTDVTTYMKVVHPSPDVDDRQMHQMANAGSFRAAEIPALDARRVHLAGVTDQEFDVAFVQGMKSRGYRLSADMQSFVRQVDPTSRRVLLRDVAGKQEIVRLFDMVKLDSVEAKLLTGSDDLEQAAVALESWGCPEVMVTRADGVLARVNHVTYWEPFSNRSAVGRTGRGDTAFGAYVSRRLDHDAEASLKFAAALTSLKLEKAGPFAGTLTDVLERMDAKATP